MANAEFESIDDTTLSVRKIGGHYGVALREYLAAIDLLWGIIHSLNQRKKKLLSSVGVIPNNSFSRVGSDPGFKSGAAYESVVDSCVDIELEIIAVKERVKCMVDRLTPSVELVSKPLGAEIFQLRYGRGMRMSDIASKLGYSLSHVHHVHGVVIDVLELKTPGLVVSNHDAILISTLPVSNN